MPFSVKKISIVVDADELGRRQLGEELAYRHADGSDEWQDPYGGFFTEEEQAQLTAVAEGESNYVDLGEGTKHERSVMCRAIVKFRE